MLRTAVSIALAMSLAAASHVHASGASCSVSPDPSTVGTYLTLTGTGLPIDSYIGMSIQTPTTTELFTSTWDGQDGTISVQWPASSFEVGSDTATLYDLKSSPTGHGKAIATCTFSVS